MLFSMNKLVLIVIACLLLSFFASDTQAQFRWNGALEVGLSQSQNLFKSPDRLLNEGELLSASNLHQNDMIIPLRADAGIEFRSPSNRIELDYTGTMDRYDQYGNLNGEYHSVRLRDTWAASKSVDLQLSLEGRKSKKIGTNALGDQLSRIFQYTAAQSILSMDWEVSRRHTLGVLYAFSYRDYTESANALSLDSYSHKASLDWRYRSRKKQGAYWQADAEVEYRLKSYVSYLARNANGDQAATHPTNKLHHISFELGLRRSISKHVMVELEAAGRYRYDFFDGYYSYGAGAVDFGIEWEPFDRLTVEGTVGARQIHFFTKIAPQADSFTAPLLRYTYLNGEFVIHYDVISWVSLETFVSTSNRYSNATLESRLTRRSYETVEAGASLIVDLDRALR